MSGRERRLPLAQDIYKIGVHYDNSNRLEAFAIRRWRITLGCGSRCGVEGHEIGGADELGARAPREEIFCTTLGGDDLAAGWDGGGSGCLSLHRNLRNGEAAPLPRANRVSTRQYTETKAR